MNIINKCSVNILMGTMIVSTQLPADMQQRNLYENIKKMHGIPGWEIWHDAELIALKSPAQKPFTHYVWGSATQENIEKMNLFFKNQPFCWVLHDDQDDKNLVNAGFSGPHKSPEMVLDLNAYTLLQESSAEIEVVEATTDDLFEKWCMVASESFNVSVAHVREFFLPLIQIAGDIPYLAFYNGEPAATSLVFCGKQEAGVYAMSVREKFRRKGLGMAVAHACIKTAQQHGLPYAVLYSSEIGLHLYEKIGFKTVQVLREYYYPSN